MRKINKIMMMTVAILLSLVLITSSVVSGTLAKYTTSSSSSDSARVAKWGVTVEASYGEEFHDVVTNKNETDEGKKVVITPNSDGIGVKITNLKLAPGDDFSDAIHFTITGKPETKVRIKITAAISFNDEKEDDTSDPKNNFYVDESIGGIKNRSFVPYGFTFGLYQSGVTPTFENSSIVKPGLPTGIGKNFVANIETVIQNVGGYTKNKPYFAHMDFAPNTDIVFTSKDGKVTSNEIYLGFYWPFEYENATDGITKAEFDDISTWLLKNRNPKFNITYTVTVEQAQE